MKIRPVKVETLKSLRKGFWGNSWGNWGIIFLVLLVLYAIEAGYLTGLLFISRVVRGTSYKSLSSQYFGHFDTENLGAQFAYFPPVPASTLQYFNRPADCVQLPSLSPSSSTDNTTYIDAQNCTSSVDNTGWTLFPWVVDSNASGAFPGCWSAEGATILTPVTSPAYVPPSDEQVVQVPFELVACQNYVLI